MAQHTGVQRVILCLKNFEYLKCQAPLGSQSSASRRADKCQAHRQIPCPDGHPAATHLLKDSNNTTTAIMAALNKIAPTSPSRQHPSELETSIANALYDLESNIPDMKSALRPLQFVSAREVRGHYCDSHHIPFNTTDLDISLYPRRMELPHPHPLRQTSTSTNKQYARIQANPLPA